MEIGVDRSGYTEKGNAPAGRFFSFPEGGIFACRYPVHLAATGLALTTSSSTRSSADASSIQVKNAPPGGIFTFLKGGIFTLATRATLRLPVSRRLLPPVLDRPLTRPSITGPVFSRGNHSSIQPAALSRVSSEPPGPRTGYGGPARHGGSIPGAPHNTKRPVIREDAGRFIYMKNESRGVFVWCDI